MYDELALDTVNDVLDHAAKRFGDRIALVDGPSRYTFRDLHAQVLQAAVELVQSPRALSAVGPFDARDFESHLPALAAR